MKLALIAFLVLRLLAAPIQAQTKETIQEKASQNIQAMSKAQLAAYIAQRNSDISAWKKSHGVGDDWHQAALTLTYKHHDSKTDTWQEVQADDKLKQLMWELEAAQKLMSTKFK